MVKLRENKTKLRTKTKKNVSNSKVRRNACKTSVNSSSISISSSSNLDYTLPDDNHLDSFDRFLVDGKRQLKPTLKKTIRASFNRDSSIEYSSNDEHSSDESNKIESNVNDSPLSADSDENVNPNAERKSFLFGCSINSSNSWMFSRSVRENRRKKKLRADLSKKAEKEIIKIRKTAPKRSLLDRKSSMTASTPVQNPFKKRMNCQISAMNVDETKNDIEFNWDDSPSTVDKIEVSPIESNTPILIANEENDDSTNIIFNETAHRSPRLSETLEIYSSFSSVDGGDSMIDRRSGIERILEKSNRSGRRRSSVPVQSMQPLYETVEQSLVENETNEQQMQNETPININPVLSNRVSIRRRLIRDSGSITSAIITVNTENTNKNEISLKLFDSTTNDNEIASIVNDSESDNSKDISQSIQDESSNISSDASNSDIFDGSKIGTIASYANKSSSPFDSIQNESDTIEATNVTNISNGKDQSEFECSTKILEKDDNCTNQSELENDLYHSTSKFLDSVVDSSISSNQPTTSAAVSISVESPKRSLKPRVEFGMVDSIHELSTNTSQISEQTKLSPKIVMKGGKWRRTIYDIRNSKLSNSLRVSKERKSSVKASSKPKVSARASRAFIISRKSILVKDIPNRKTVESVRKPSQNLIVLDESDAESICSSDFSPRPRSINVLSKIRSSRLLQQQNVVDDCVDFEKRRSQSQYNRKSTGLHHLSICSTSSSIDSVVDELEDLTTSLNLGYDQQELKAQLLKRCGQTNVLSFSDVYSARNLKKCRKIGEGVFGEVFLNEISARSSYVLKIIPIEGEEEINGAQQKRFHEILQEIIISQELSGLRYGKTNATSGFVEVLNVRLVEGRYPSHLLKLWHEYNICDQSENDCPDIFGDDQLYVVFELANCGLDLEANIFKNAEQSLSALQQVAISLAVAETEFQFEHRDLHWGNVLVTSTAEKFVTYYLNGKTIEIPTNGVKATIIDYTLSRLVYKGQCLFQDLAADPELFEASGDYQYDIYRLMRTQTNNYWEVFEPFTNILWLHYLVDKMIDGIRYTSRRAAKHRSAIDELMRIRDVLMEYRSATDYIECNQ